VSLATRLKKAESRNGHGGECPGCGWTNGQPPIDLSLEVNVYCAEHDELPPEEFCEECGAQLSFNLQFGRI
jgi:hypothetical protein